MLMTLTRSRPLSRYRKEKPVPRTLIPLTLLALLLTLAPTAIAEPVSPTETEPSEMAAEQIAEHIVVTASDGSCQVTAPPVTPAAGQCTAFTCQDGLFCTRDEQCCGVDGSMGYCDLWYYECRCVP